MEALRRLLDERIVVLDGAWGTTLQGVFSEIDTELTDNAGG